MSFHDLKTRVLDPSLCATCGACELACPQGMIRFDLLEPRLAAGFTDQDCGACRDCLTVCPGLDPATPEAERRLFGRTRDPGERWLGIRRAVFGAHSTTPEIFARSASGGSATTLLQVAMRHLELDAVLVMGRSAEQPWRSAPAVCASPAELPAYAQSTYQLAPYLGALRPFLEKGGRVGLVGIACHIQGARKLQGMDSRLGELARERIAFMLEIGCSSSTRPRGTETLITEMLGLDLGEVAGLKYREGDYPGRIEVTTRDGRRHTVEFWQAVRHFADNKTHRCLSCGDWMSGLADLSASDGDPNIFNASLGLNAVPKHGRVFVRTETGARVLEQAVAEGALAAWPLDLIGLNLGLERKRNRRAAYERKGVPIPEGPIPGWSEEIEIVDDADLLRVPGEPPSAREGKG
jgi:coenzyme F420 hydrogenase subunit beta